MLKKITAMTQGRYVRSVAGDMDLEQIYSGDILNTMEQKELTQGRKKVWEKRFQWALLPCVLLLIAETCFPQGSGRKHGVKGGRSLICLAIALGLMAPGVARAGFWTSPVKQGMQAWDDKQFQQAKKHFIDAQLENPDDPRLYYNIGAAAYAAGEYDLAESNFAQAVNAKDRELKHNALYNLANTRYRQNHLEKAIADYQSLINAFPDDTQAKENLEFVKKKLEEQKQQQQDQKNQDQKIKIKKIKTSRIRIRGINTKRTRITRIRIRTRRAARIRKSRPKNRIRIRRRDRIRKTREIKTGKINLKKIPSSQTNPKRTSIRICRHKSPKTRLPRQERPGRGKRERRTCSRQSQKCLKIVSTVLKTNPAWC
jgi:Flp pilus assembly protein TadD, contains TPR repeats